MTELTTYFGKDCAGIPLLCAGKATECSENSGLFCGSLEDTGTKSSADGGELVWHASEEGQTLT